MIFGKETKEKVCKFDVDFEENEWDMLKKYGLKTIKTDESALVNYAVNDILRKEVERKEAERNRK